MELSKINCRNKLTYGVCVALMAWGTYLETGHPEMDRQHQRLVELINQLYLAPSPQGDQPTELLVDFLDFVERHFQWEEALMEQLHYPDQEQHRSTHNLKRLDLARLGRLYRTGASGSIGDWMVSMHDWFLSQILQEDRGLATFLLKLEAEHPTLTPN